MAVHIRQAESSALVPERKLFMIDAHQMKDGRLKIMDVNRLLDDVKAILVGRT